MINHNFKSIQELLKAFPNEQSCIDHLTELRWPDGNIISPFDEVSQVYICKGNKYRCRNTKKYFNVKTQTLFENTKIPLQTWFLAIWLICGHKKGISSLQLASDLNVTQKSTWFLLHRIRNCYGMDNDEDQFSNEVEIDESYIGGKNKNRHAHKKVEASQGRSHKDKSPVLGILERGGKVKAIHVEDVSSHTLTPEIVKLVKKEALIYTDEWLGYKSLERIYDHMVVKHNEGKYVNGRIHVNTLEGFWSLLKRMIIGTYHFTSKKHLQKYVDEMVFRYNTRNSKESLRFNLMLAQATHRLTYEALIHG